ncbi:DedA family protein [Pelagibacteraceae bacterium]|nr:DedA family protein [Pelagibacteraceae bacterium]
MSDTITAIGYLGLMLIIFLETGVFFGFFLPGDSLLFVAGMLAAEGVFDIKILIPVLAITAFIGYCVGYGFGYYLGNWLLAKRESFWFRKEYLERAKKFYDRHGGKTLIFGRLVPIVRTFVPVVAGMSKMPLRKYMIYNAIGAIFWAFSLPILGYSLGEIIPDAGRYVLPIVLVVIIISISPGIIRYIKRTRVSPLKKG